MPKGVLADFSTPILPNIIRQPTREALIKVHQIISLNAASVAPNLCRGHHGHLELIIIAKDNLAQTGHVFVPPHNPGDWLAYNGNHTREEAW